METHKHRVPHTSRACRALRRARSGYRVARTSSARARLKSLAGWYLLSFPRPRKSSSAPGFFTLHAWGVCGHSCLWCRASSPPPPPFPFLCALFCAFVLFALCQLKRVYTRHRLRELQHQPRDLYTPLGSSAGVSHHAEPTPLRPARKSFGHDVDKLPTYEPPGKHSS